MNIFDTDLMYDKRWRKKPKYGKWLVFLIILVICLVVIAHNRASKEIHDYVTTHNELTFLV